MRRAAGFFAFLLVLAAIGVMPARADEGFDRWVSEFWPVAKAAGISRETYQSAFAGVELDPEVVEKARHQAEFVKPLGEYIEGAASEDRIRNGRDMLSRYGGELAAIEKKFGVDRHVLVAIWGMESSYGAVLGNPKIVKSVVQSLATLAYADRKRARFGRTQLLAALQIVERGDVSVAGLTGSWAGAMGHTQFIPTSYQEYAVDFDGDGRRNVWTSEVDALASAANLLARSGWVSGKTWGYEVVLPEGFDYAQADEKTRRTIAQWEKMGISRPQGAFPRRDDKAVLMLPAGARGPAFLILRNHYVLKRYNNATSYAMGVGHLADRLKGGDAIAQAWPISDRPLTRSEMKELQSHLSAAGLYSGEIDGSLGAGSRKAIRAYQSRIGMAPDGHAGSGLLSRLRGG